MKKTNLKTNLIAALSSLNPVFVGLSLISTVLVVGCVPPKKEGPAPIQTKVVSVSEQTSACETQIKNQIEAKTLKLVEAAGLEADIKKANALFSSLTNVEYNVQQIRKEIQSVGIELFHRTSDSAFSVSYEISKGEKDTGAILALAISSEQINKGSSVGISQDLLVNPDCTLTVSQTSKLELVKSDTNEVTLLTTEVFVDGGKTQNTDKFTLNDSEVLINLLPNSDDFALVPKVGAIFIPGIGLGRYNVTTIESSVAKEFGLDLVFNNYKIEITFSPDSSLSMIYSEDQAKKITLSDVANQKNWGVPREIWTELILGSSPDLNSYIQFLLPNDYLETNDSLILEAKKSPAYDHFAAYWQVKNVTENSDSGTANYTLVANPNPVIEGPISAWDLESNTTIQTELPQIQKIANEIAAQSKDRVGQIQLILNYLNKNYSYDYEMIKNNVVRPLTTEDALSRGKGVCQHYAVIFTAVARALKIPTRIVMGYHLSGNAAGSHAWVEAVIADGKGTDDHQWKVIEPQSATTLQDMNTRYYLPTIRARLLEDRINGTAQSIGDLLDIEYSLKPVSVR